MAGISTSISLANNVSGPINAIINSLNATVKAFDEVNSHSGINMDTSAVKAGISQVQYQLTSLQANTEAAARNQEQLNRSMRTGSSVSSDLTNKIKSLVGAYVSFQGIKGILNTADELSNTTARLGFMAENFRDVNGQMQSADSLFKEITASANNSRALISDMTNLVARFGTNAKDAFSSNKEVIDFANTVQKAMTVSGASVEEAAAAELQLSQALGSGVLRGDELTSVFEQAPYLMQLIADYMDVPITQIRNMAEEGQLTSDIVKNAILDSANEVDRKFNDMPVTFGQIWTQFRNDALVAFQPVLKKISELTSNEDFQNGIQTIFQVMTTAANVALIAIQKIGQAVNWVKERWETIGPVVKSVAKAVLMVAAALTVVRAIQAVVNTLANMNPIVLAIMGVVTAITLVCDWVARTSDAAESGLGVFMGVIYTIGAFIQNAAIDAYSVVAAIALSLVAIIQDIGAGIANIFLGIVGFIGTVGYDIGMIFANLGIGIANVFLAMVNTVVALIENLGIAFANLGIGAANVFLGIISAAKAVGSNMKAAFTNSIADIKIAFYSLMATASEVIINIANGLNKLPFVNIDTSGLTSAADSWKTKAEAEENNKTAYKDVAQAYKDGQTLDYLQYKDVGKAASDGFNTFGYNSLNDPTKAFGKGAGTFDYKSVADAWSKGWNNDEQKNRINYSDARKNGAAFGDGITNKLNTTLNSLKGTTTGSGAYQLGNYSGLASSALKNAAGDTAKNTGKIAKNTDSMSKALDITSAQQKYLLDLADRKIVNRFTSANVDVHMTNNNSISKDADVDSITDSLVTGIRNALVISGGAVHV